jgi:hypothetical protein
VKLTPEQKKIAREIVRRGKSAGASPMEVKSAIETGLVESNLRNLPGGDADSQGWRQERKSLYPNPRDLGASIDRYFRETKAAKGKGKYGNAGDLAAAVQRPAAQYRGRYAQRGGDAAEILRALGGKLGDAPVSRTDRDVSFTRDEATFDQPGYEAARRKATVAAFLEKRGKGHGLLFKTGALSSKAPDPAAFTGSRTVADTVKVKGEAEPKAKDAPAGGGKRPAKNLLELFYDPTSTGVKHGQKIAPIGGHSDHVHVASGPKQIASLKKLAVEMGLTITSTTGGKHAPNSYHYSGKAIDVAGDPKKMAAFTRAVKKRYGV